MDAGEPRSRGEPSSSDVRWRNLKKNIHLNTDTLIWKLITSFTIIKILIEIVKKEKKKKYWWTFKQRLLAPN